MRCSIAAVQQIYEKPVTMSSIILQKDVKDLREFLHNRFKFRRETLEQTLEQTITLKGIRYAQTTFILIRYYLR